MDIKTWGPPCRVQIDIAPAGGLIVYATWCERGTVKFLTKNTDTLRDEITKLAKEERGE